MRFLPRRVLPPRDRQSKNFLESPPVARALQQARTADVILVSVGVIGSESLVLAEGFMTTEAMDRVIAAGAVRRRIAAVLRLRTGEKSRYPGLHPIALTLDDLRNASRVISVASCAEKAAAVRAAIASGILNEIVVDETLVGSTS